MTSTRKIRRKQRQLSRMRKSGMITDEQYLKRYHYWASKDKNLLDILEQQIMNDAKNAGQDPEDALNQYYEMIGK